MKWQRVHCGRNGSPEESSMFAHCDGGLPTDNA